MPEETSEQMNGTAEGLLAFLDWAGSKGVMGRHTAISYKTSVVKVFEIDSESWRTIDIRKFDPDLQLDRFARLRGARYSPTSLRTYGNRFKAAISAYKRYLDDPANFRGPNAPAIRSTKASPKKSASGHSSASPGPIDQTRNDEGDLINYPFPLRSGVIVYLSLPRDLRKAEASRIGAFVASLAVEPIPELGAG